MKSVEEKTREHIQDVANNLNWMIQNLQWRAINHDLSKLWDPEAEIFEEWTSKLAGVTYGTKEYEDMLQQMKPAIDHHYKMNRHHPEHFADGIAGMNLIDLVEMFCDWMAAARRHDDGDAHKSLEINTKRFNIPSQLVDVFRNTIDEYVSRETKGPAL